MTDQTSTQSFIRWLEDVATLKEPQIHATRGIFRVPTLEEIAPALEVLRTHAEAQAAFDAIAVDRIEPGDEFPFLDLSDPKNPHIPPHPLKSRHETEVERLIRLSGTPAAGEDNRSEAERLETVGKWLKMLEGPRQADLPMPSSADLENAAAELLHPVLPISDVFRVERMLTLLVKFPERRQNAIDIAYGEKLGTEFANLVSGELERVLDLIHGFAKPVVPSKVSTRLTELHNEVLEGAIDHQEIAARLAAAAEALEVEEDIVHAEIVELHPLEQIMVMLEDLHTSSDATTFGLTNMANLRAQIRSIQSYAGNAWDQAKAAASQASGPSDGPVESGEAPKPAESRTASSDLGSRGLRRTSVERDLEEAARESDNGLRAQKLYDAGRKLVKDILDLQEVIELVVTPLKAVSENYLRDVPAPAELRPADHEKAQWAAVINLKAAVEFIMASQHFRGSVDTQEAVERIGQVIMGLTGERPFHTLPSQAVDAEGYRIGLRETFSLHGQGAWSNEVQAIVEFVQDASPCTWDTEALVIFVDVLTEAYARASAAREELLHQRNGEITPEQPATTLQLKSIHDDLDAILTRVPHRDSDSPEMRVVRRGIEDVRENIYGYLGTTPSNELRFCNRCDIRVDDEPKRTEADVVSELEYNERVRLWFGNTPNATLPIEITNQIQRICNQLPSGQRDTLNYAVRLGLFADQLIQAYAELSVKHEALKNQPAPVKPDHQVLQEAADILWGLDERPRRRDIQVPEPRPLADRVRGYAHDITPGAEHWTYLAKPVDPEEALERVAALAASSDSEVVGMIRTNGQLVELTLTDLQAVIHLARRQEEDR
jgi:hypothetical protein